MPLVYPHFSLSREAAAILDAAGFDCQSVFQKTVPNPNWKHKVDLADAVAVNDIEALLHVSFCFSDVLGSPPKIIPDSAAVLNTTASFLSFGFSSNDLTHLFLENCEHPPFVIRSESDATVRFKEYIDVLLEDGSMQTFRSAQDQQIGVIAKFKPSFETDSEVVWIICGGLGPEATIGAGYYLAHAWRAIYKQVGDAEFLCLVKVPKNAPTLPRCCFLTPKKNVREEKAAYEPATSSLSR
jgi:hypothetical protein